MRSANVRCLKDALESLAQLEGRDVGGLTVCVRTPTGIEEHFYIDCEGDRVMITPDSFYAENKNGKTKKGGKGKMIINGIDTRHLPLAERQRLERKLGKRHTEEHRVFVYGTLLTGEHNAHWAVGARRQRATAVGTIYDTGWGFPAFVKKGRTRIVGELLTVNEAGFKSMDRLEGYPRLYRREEITVYPSTGGRTKAWVYIMNCLPENAKVIEGGDWRNRKRAD